MAPIRPLAWEPPYVVRAALKRPKKKKKKIWSKKLHLMESKRNKEYFLKSYIEEFPWWLSG